MAWASGRLWLQPEGDVGPSAQPAFAGLEFSVWLRTAAQLIRILVRGLAAKSKARRHRSVFRLVLGAPEGGTHIADWGRSDSEAGKRILRLVSIVVVASGNKESGDQQQQNLTRFMAGLPRLYWRWTVVGATENGTVGPALSHCWVLASSAAARLTALAATTFCALIMATTNCLSI